MAEFEFDKELQAQNSIEIENIGDFGLEAVDEDGLYYYLVVKTLLGNTLIASCGPIIPDLDILPNGYSCNLIKMPYKEDKICKQIALWLNNPHRKIKDAITMSFDDAATEFKDVGNYLLNLSEDTM